MGNLFSRGSSPPAAPNPSVAEIEARNLAEKATRDAQAAKELAEKIQNDALAESQRMQARLDAVTGEAAEAEEDARRMRDAIIASESPEAAAATQQEALKQAKEELERARQTIEEARRAEAAARAEAERRWQAAEEGRRRAEAARADADRATRAAQAEAQKAAAAKEEAEKRWKAGIQPVLEKAKRRIQYKEGSGKSSLINAFRGLRNKDAGAAATGVVETTLTMTRYPDPNPQHPFVWFDIPGAGTLKITDWQYFNAQGLYVFDCIIVLFDNRFTMTDIAILSNARRFQIPTYIHIRNLMRDMGYDSEEDDEDDPGRRKRLYTAARRQYIEETRKSVKTNLENAGLPDQRVYIVSNDNLLGMVRGNAPKRTIDELTLLTDLFTEAHLRRAKCGLVCSSVRARSCSHWGFGLRHVWVGYMA
ncbi:interferon-inducible GTPase-domain-containing protein [Pisolithus tinctorius]|nr:interferon-inducible GTPase-domain-containing protein [Pisolithus tinctorius]